MPGPILAALEAEVARTADFMDSLKPDDWTLPTRCPPMTVLELSAHMWRGGVRIDEMLDRGSVDAEPEKDGATYFRYDRAQAGPQVVARAQEAALDLDAASFPARWRRSWRTSLARVSTALDDDDAVFTSIFGLMRLSEYLRTRIVEVAVHAMDLRDALGLDPDPDPHALEATADVLRELLGTDLRARGIDDVRFVLIGTGRAPLNAAELELLGPLADGFPLLA